ncbi:galactose ABC transporter substrate-binding protein [Enterococcus devriesei]|uniref:galactose ABC transporter substrate-binding protein n=1 Tax=Enterococcus devriesei TaxID=319970 RepID=UPI002890A9D4|nr:galactose ABC transporter substrate-binding protein [Enterococcus devriesei]MDT2820919.1 galactose ABC transporter substrate-binding protein [Enterococcus devriesei]
MKKLSFRIALLFFALSFLFLGLGLKNYYQKQQKEQVFKIGVLLYRGDDEFISTVADSLEKKKAEFKEKYGQEMVITFRDAKQNQSVQNQQVDYILQNDYDALVVNTVDRTVASGIIEKAKQASVPVIFFNREPVEKDLERWDKAFYVGSSARESGELEAQIVVDHWKKNPQKLDLNGDGFLQYVLLEGEETHQDSLIRTESSIQYLTDAGIKLQRLHRGTADWMRRPAYDLMKNWLNEGDDKIELVISNNDDMALGALDAVNDSKINYLPTIVGIDGTKAAIDAVNAKKMLGTVINSNEEQAEMIIDLAAACGMKQNVRSAVPTIKGQYVWVPYKIFTK